MVVIVDDEDRENEGDLIMAAELVRPQDINFMVTHARGLVCLSLTRERCRQLGLPPMVRDNTSPHHTNFTVSHRGGRRRHHRHLRLRPRAHHPHRGAPGRAAASDLSQPGHIFPLMAQPGGVLNRAGHTEAASDLALLAGLEPAGVLVEILNADGSMARRPELEAFAREHGLKIGSIEELIRHRLATEHTVERVDEREIETEHGPFRLRHLSRPPQPRRCISRWCAATPTPRRRRWCACTCRTRWPTRCTGAAPISARRSATCWRAIAARGPRRAGAAGRARRSPTPCSRASARSRADAAAAPRAAMPWPNGAATAPARRSWPTSAWASCACWARRAGRSGLAGFGLEVVEYVEPTA